MSISVVGNMGSVMSDTSSIRPADIGSNIRELRAMTPVGVSGTGDGVVSLSERAVTQVGGFDIGGEVYAPDQDLANALDLMMNYGSTSLAAAGGTAVGLTGI
jgi:hypothetical protein